MKTLFKLMAVAWLVLLIWLMACDFETKQWNCTTDMECAIEEMEKEK